MSADSSNLAMRHLSDLFQVGTVAGLSDAELLERFLRGAEKSAETAFAALVERHGAMVLRVCRGLLANHHEAEDAFQATFLVLARKARTLRDPARLTNWLYGVAHRTARKTRAQSLRRGAELRVGGDAIESAIAESAQRPDVLLLRREEMRVVHEEIERLPEKERSVIVLFYLEELTVEETARRLRCTNGAVRGRLDQARDRLRKRLAHRKLTVLSSAFPAALSAQKGMTAIAPELLSATVRTAMVEASKTLNASGLQAAFAEMTRQISRKPAFSLIALGTIGVISIAAAILAVSPRQGSQRDAKDAILATQPPTTEARRLVERMDWTLSDVKPGERAIELQSGKGRAGKQTKSLIQFKEIMALSGLVLEGLKLAPLAHVVIDGQPAELADLREGMRITIELLEGSLEASVVNASTANEDSPFAGIVERVDASNRLVTLSGLGTVQNLENVQIADDARLSWFRARPDEAISFQALRLEELPVGTPVSIHLVIREDGQLSIVSLTAAR